jgi:hypothetical protein
MYNQLKYIKVFEEAGEETSGDVAVYTKQYPDYLLIIGTSEELFDYFEVDEMHGLKKEDCYDTPTDAYIAGLCNIFPADLDKPPNKQRNFLFINRVRIGRSYKDVLLIMHESMHLSLEVHGANLEVGDLEEQVITYAEATATEICEQLRKLDILTIG